jgi:hypothetical protein
MRIVFPSGMITENRPMQGNELLTMASARAKKLAGGGIAEVFRACWIATEATGPYRFVSGDASPDWKRIGTGDVLTAMLQHKAAALGGDTMFPMVCQGCGRRVEVWVNVEEFELKPIPKGTEVALREGQPLETRLLDGRRVEFHIATMTSEEYVEAQLKQMKRRPEWENHVPTFIDLMAGRIRSIEGVDNSNEFVKRLQHLLFLDARVLYDLRDKMDDAEFGIDTEVEFPCEHCGTEQTQDVPLDAGFFSGQKRKPKAATTGTPTKRSETEASSG